MARPLDVLGACWQGFECDKPPPSLAEVYYTQTLLFRDSSAKRGFEYNKPPPMCGVLFEIAPATGREVFQFSEGVCRYGR